MVRIVVFHHDNSVREQMVDAFRHAGFITYDATDTRQALNAVKTYHPDVVITDFPALIDDDARFTGYTLTEAIRRDPALRDVAILNLSENAEGAVSEYAAKAGVTKSLMPSTSVERIVETVQEISRKSQAWGH